MISELKNFNGLETANAQLLYYAAPWLGLSEVKGAASNKRILDLIRQHRDGVFSWARDDGEVAYCSIWLEAVVHSACAIMHPLTNHKKTALALSWEHSGVPICWRDDNDRLVGLDKILPGDVLRFTRGKGWGHVALACDNRGSHYRVMGANQSNGINTMDYSVSRLVGATRLYLDPSK